MKPTREQILSELAERASLPDLALPAGLTPEQELAWLQNLIDTRRTDMGIQAEVDGSPIGRCPTTAKRRLA